MDPKVFFHVHPDGKALHLLPDGKIETRTWTQPPSNDDIRDALSPEALGPKRSIIVFAAGEKKVYFYDSSGVTGSMGLTDFLRR